MISLAQCLVSKTVVSLQQEQGTAAALAQMHRHSQRFSPTGFLIYNSFRHLLVHSILKVKHVVFFFHLQFHSSVSWYYADGFPTLRKWFLFHYPGTIYRQL